MNIFATLLAALFAYLSAHIAWYGAMACFDCIRMFRAGQCTKGTVSGVKTEEKWRKGKLRITYSAIISFNTDWHEKREVVYANPLGTDAFKVGDKVKIWYDTNDPKVFTLGGKYFIQDMASIVIGMLCLGLPGWGILYQMAKHYIAF